MKIERIRNNHKKKLIIGGLIVTSVLTVGIFASSYSKYRVTESIKLGEGIINYSNADFELIGMYLINEDNTETKIDVVPGDGYILNEEKTKCTVNNTEISASIEYKNNKLYFGDITNKGTKCKVYFNKIIDREAPVINEVETEKNDTSIKVTVTAQDNNAVTKYFYQIGNNELEESTSPIHTFNDLTRGKKYTIKIYVTDSTGNKSNIWINETSLTASGSITDTLTPQIGTDTFTGPSTENEHGLYKTTENTEEVYYYRGSGTLVNNWIDFAGFKWRIIRTNSDGSIRIIYNGNNYSQTGTGTQIGTSKFNANQGNNTYVGYMYGARSGTYSQTHENKNNSTIKAYLDNWYKTNIEGKNYSQYVSSEAGFCNDRKVQNIGDGYTNNGTGTGRTGYAARYRLFDGNKYRNQQTVTLDCSQSNDLFTIASSSKGNHALTYPIGLITSDEVVYAGGFGGTNNQNYWLYTGQSYWTMSPSNYHGGGGAWPYEFYVNNGGLYGGNISDNNNVTTYYGVRPVINLDKNVKLTGSGTTTDPFKIVE